MDKSEKVPELKMFSNTNKNKSENCFQPLNPEVTVKQIFPASPHRDQYIPTFCSDAPVCRTHTGGQKVEVRGQPARLVQHVELMQQRQPANPGATPARMNIHHQNPDVCCPHPTVVRSQGDMRGQCCCWDCRPNQCRTTGETYR